ncbi:MAG: threonine/serine exporter family protein [Muricomes sp.]
MILLLGVIGSFIAVGAFAVLLETPRKYLIHAGITGAIGGFVYLFGVQKDLNVVLATFFSALAIALAAHTFARILKAPVTIFLIAGILPTVPGAGMYRIVYYIIANDSAKSSYYLMQTLETAGVIALAIFIMDTLFKVSIKKIEKQ